MEFYLEEVWTDSEDIMNYSELREYTNVDSIPDLDNREDNLISLIQMKDFCEILKGGI